MIEGMQHLEFTNLPKSIWELPDSKVRNINKLKNMRKSNMELSYMDLLLKLYNDVTSDECMPEKVKQKVFRLIDKLEAELESYSA